MFFSLGVILNFFFNLCEIKTVRTVIILNLNFIKCWKPSAHVRAAVLSVKYHPVSINIKKIQKS